LDNSKQFLAYLYSKAKHLSKVTRIFFKSLGAITLSIILLAVFLFFAIQSPVFQTWLGQKTGSYLSSELNNKITIKKIHIEFFKIANLEGVFVSDKNNDTLFTGDLLVDINKLDYKQKKIAFKKITLKNSTTKLINYKNDSKLNFQFLVDYINTNQTDTVSKQNWEVEFGDVVLDNVNFIYRDENKNTTLSQNINFNNLYLTKTYGKISKINFKNDTIFAKLSHLKTNEQCGFKLNELSTESKISNNELLLSKLTIKTPQTCIKGDINFLYSEWNDYSDFVNKIKIKSTLADSTYIAMQDIAKFTSELNGLDAKINLSGKVNGYVNDLTLKEFYFAYGNDTKFRGNLTLTGLPNFSTSYLHINAKEIATSYNDIIQIPNYPFTENKKIELPIELKKLGKISYKGKFDGFITDFTTYGKFNTNLGSVKTELSIKTGKNEDNVSYHGKIETTNFDIGTLLGIKNFNALSLNTEIKGKGLSIKSIDADLNGEILGLNFNQYMYKNINLNGHIRKKIFNGIINCKDENADFDFNGTINFTNKLPEMDFISTINNLDLKKLNFLKSESKLSTQILIKLNGDNINNLSGYINFDNTIFKNAEKKFKINNIDLKLDQETEIKKIILNSSYFNFVADGKFDNNNLSLALNQVLNAYYPTFFMKNKGKIIYKDAFNYKLTIKKFNLINELFIKELMVSPNTTIGGEFNAFTNLITVNLKSDSIKYGDIIFNNNVIESFSKNNKINLVFKGSNIRLTDSIYLKNYFMYLVSKDLDTKYNFEWNNKGISNSAGKLAGKVSFSKQIANLTFDNFFISSKDSSIWNLVTANPTTIDTSGNIIINPLLFTNNKQNISVAGALTNHANDSLAITVSNLTLEQFNPILKDAKIKLEGKLNGRVTIHDPKAFAFSSNLNFSDLKLNNNTIGKLIVKTNYVASTKTIYTDGYTSLGLPTLNGEEMKNISFKGYYYLNKDDENIDIDLKASPANLKLLNPLLEGIMTVNNALISGDGKIHGTPNNIKIDGKFKLYNSEIKIDYTNVTYNITGDIEIMPDQIRFDDLSIKEVGNKKTPQGTINGNIFHNNFNKMRLDYDISFKNMLVLNTNEKQNNTFYGKAYATGNVGIYGFLNNLHMSVNAATNKNSKFILPLDGPAEITESDFIHFVKKDTSIKKSINTHSGFDLDMNINATPDLQVQIILDKTNGDVLNVQGNGDINLKISTLGKFEMFGEYKIKNGDYLFTLENVINKKFDIDAGSSILWSGNPLNAEIDIATTYKQRASVAPLLNDTTGRYKGRFPVECKLLIKNKLFSPSINFDILFPNIDATAKARINNVLSDEVELNRQVFSFLLFRSFVTPQIYNSNSGGVTAGNAAASTGSEMLSNRVSEFLNSYFGNLTGMQDLNLGLNYRPGNQNNTEAVDLALSKQFFNNKITVDGNFGVNNNQANNTSGLIGDVNVEYKLTDDGRYRVKGFNRSNDNTQITTSGGPYTQGVGFFYREEFETINELFKRYLEKFKRKNTASKS